MSQAWAIPAGSVLPVGAIMSKILPVVFVLILGMVGVGMDVYLYQQKGKVPGALDAQASDGYLAYVAQRLQSQAQTAAVADMDLATYLPAAPAGWDRRAFEVSDAEALSGRPYIKTDLALDSTNDMISGMRTTRISGRHIVDTYLSGDTRIIVAVSFGPAGIADSFLGKMTSEIQSGIDSGGAFNDSVFAFVKGVNFVSNAQISVDHQTKIETPVGYRRFDAKLGQQARFVIMTNATDAELLQVITQIDVVGLNANLQNPEPQVHVDKPVLAAAELKALSGPDLAALGAALAPPQPGKVKLAEVAKGKSQTAKADTPHITSKGCVRRAGKLDCPKD